MKDKNKGLCKDSLQVSNIAGMEVIRASLCLVRLAHGVVNACQCLCVDACLVCQKQFTCQLNVCV